MYALTIAAKSRVCLPCLEERVLGDVGRGEGEDGRRGRCREGRTELLTEGEGEKVDSDVKDIWKYIVERSVIDGY